MNYSLSTKINEKYETVISISEGQYGPYLSINRKILVDLLKDESRDKIFLNIKDWGEQDKKDLRTPGERARDDLATELDEEPF